MKNEDENDLGMNINDDINSDILSKKSSFLSNKTKLIISISISLLIIITIIIILILFLSKKNKNHKEDESINPELVTAEILCKYYIETSLKEIALLSSEYNLDLNIDIYINDKKIKLLKE